MPLIDFIAQGIGLFNIMYQFAPDVNTCRSATQQDMFLAR